MKRLTATLQKEEDMYVAHCPEIGTVSQGRSIKSALANLKEATELYLEEFPSTQPKNHHTKSQKTSKKQHRNLKFPAERDILIQKGEKKEEIINLSDIISYPTPEIIYKEQHL